MTTKLPQEEIDELTIIFEQYTKNLLDKLHHIEKLCDQLQNQFSYESLSELCQVVHKLSGSCETFGYKELGNTARKLELVLINIQKKQSLYDANSLLPVIRKLKDIYLATPIDDAFDNFLQFNMKV